MTQSLLLINLISHESLRSINTRRMPSPAKENLFETIANAQKSYENDLKNLETEYEEEVKTLAASHELNKENLFETHVAGVLKGFNM